MNEVFDPYHHWLGVAPEEQPANHYRLLGLRTFESDADVIESAADKQMSHVRSFQIGKHADEAQRILSEIAIARIVLLNSEKKAAYDANLKRELSPAVPIAQPPRPSPPIFRPQPVEVAPRTLPVAQVSPAENHGVSVFEAYHDTIASIPANSWKWLAVILGAAAFGLLLTVVSFVLATSGGDESDDAVAADGTVFTNSVGMNLVEIPAGKFEMGSGKSAAEIAKLFDSNEEDYKDENPQHAIRLSRGFRMAAHEVTIGQFRQFVRAAGYKTEPERDGKGGDGYNASEKKFEGTDPKYTWKNAGWTVTDSHPVVNVTWNDAVAFCEWLSRKDGRKYRLPTEAEWEYACRGGSTTIFQHGNNGEGLAGVGNVADGTAKAKFDHWTGTISARDGYVFTAPVGGFKPNAFGLYDMHGNVFEWCSDWYDEDYYSKSPSVDPKGPMSGSSRVLRGGSWIHDAQHCRSAQRHWYSPSRRVPTCGFRLVCELD